MQKKMIVERKETSFFKIGIALILGAFLVFASGCKKDQPLGQGDLLRLKREEIQNGQGNLTPEEEMRILGIRARTESEFRKEVNRIRAERTVKAPQPASRPSGQ